MEVLTFHSLQGDVVFPCCCARGRRDIAVGALRSRVLRMRVVSIVKYGLSRDLGLSRSGIIHIGYSTNVSSTQSSNGNSIKETQS